MKELFLNEEKLIERCLERDRHAQEFLYNQHYSALYLIAMRYLSDHHDAEDAIILAFTKVFKNLKKFTFQGQGSLGKWIRTILINETIKLLKKKKELYYKDDLQHLAIKSESANGLEQLQASELLSLIERLPPGYRTIFNLFVIEGYTHKAIADLLKISENTSKTQLKKARNSLQNSINKEQANGTF